MTRHAPLLVYILYVLENPTERENSSKLYSTAEGNSNISTHRLHTQKQKSEDAQ